MERRPDDEIRFEWVWTPETHTAGCALVNRRDYAQFESYGSRMVYGMLFFALLGGLLGWYGVLSYTALLALGAAAGGGVLSLALMTWFGKRIERKRLDARAAGMEDTSVMIITPDRLMTSSRHCRSQMDWEELETVFVTDDFLILNFKLGGGCYAPLDACEADPDRLETIVPRAVWSETAPWEEAGD